MSTPPYDLSLDLLASFVVLAEELHFTRAAARLHLAQPALTKRIHQLEERFGVPLFTRTRRAVALTPAGETLLAPARALLDGAEQLGAFADRLKRGETGLLRIGFSPSAPHRVLPPLIQQFRSAYPDVRLQLSEAGSDRQIQQIAEGTLDIGILRPPLHGPDTVVCTTCYEEPFVAVLPRDHRLAARRRLSLADLAAEPFVLVSRAVAGAIYTQVMNAAAAAGFSPHIVQEGTHIHGVVALVAAGCGVSVLPQSGAAVGVKAVVTRPLSGTPLSTVMAIARLRHNTTPAVRAFVQAATRQFRAHAG